MKNRRPPFSFVFLTLAHASWPEFSAPRNNKLAKVPHASFAIIASCLLSLAAPVSVAAPQPQAITPVIDGPFTIMDTHGNVLVVGAPNAAVEGNDDQGAAYVYEYVEGTWQQTAKLLAPQGAAEDSFGTDVAVDGDVIVVSSPHADEDGVYDSGAVDVFERTGASGWAHTARLSASGKNQNDRFGRSVAIDGIHMAVVSANDGKSFEVPGGAEYIFERDPASGNWQQVARLDRDRWAVDSTTSISIDGDTLATGAYGGTAFVYEYDGSAWQEVHAMELGGGPVEVSLEGSVLVAALPRDASPALDCSAAGRVHVHERDADGVWQETAIFEAVEPQCRGEFGKAMDMSNGIVAVTGGQLGPLRTELFTKDHEGSWRRVYELEGHVPVYGRQVAISEEALALAGRSAEDDLQVSVFEMPEIIADLDVDNSPYADSRDEPAPPNETNTPFSDVIPPRPQILLRSDTPLPGDDDRSLFGYSVDTDDSLMVVGAPAVNAVYVFEYIDGEWREIEKLTYAGSTSGDEFGALVQLDGDAIAVSARGESVNGISRAGAIHLFERTEDAGAWNHSARIVSPDAVTEAKLGTRMEFDDGRILANAPGNDFAAYLFERDSTSTWVQALRFTESDGTPVGARNQALGISNDTIALVHDSDSVFIYERMGGSWVLGQQLDFDYATSVAIEDDLLVIGTPGYSLDERDRGEGAAHVYERDGSQWKFTALLASDDPYPTYGFGTGLELQDGLLVALDSAISDGSHFFARNDDDEWTHLSGSSPRLWNSSRAVAISDRVFAIGYSGDYVGFVSAIDIENLFPEDFVLGDGSGGETGDSNGGDSSDGDNDDGYDDGNGNDGNDFNDDDASGAAGDDTTGDSGDDASDEDATAGDNNDTANDDPPARDSGSGGGSAGWLLGLLLALVRLQQRRMT